jgi:hypothetical protein
MSAPDPRIAAVALALANYRRKELDLPILESVEDFRFASDRADYEARAIVALAAADAAAWQPIESAPRARGKVDLLVEASHGACERLPDCWLEADHWWHYPRQSLGSKIVRRRILAWRGPPELPDPALTQLHAGLRGDTDAALRDAEEEGRG